MQVKTLLGIVAFAGISQMASAADYIASQNGDWNSASTWGNAGVPTATDYARVPVGKTVTVAANQSEGIGILDVHGTLVIDDNAILTVDGLPTSGDTGFSAPGFHSWDGDVVLSGDTAQLQFSDRNQILDDGGTGAGMITMSDPNAAILIQNTFRVTSRIPVTGQGRIAALSGSAIFKIEQVSATVGGYVSADSGQLDLASNLKLEAAVFTSGLNTYRPEFMAVNSGSSLRFLREHDGSPDPVLEADLVVSNCANMHIGANIVTNGSLCVTGSVTFASSKTLSWFEDACLNHSNSPLGPSTYSTGCP